MKPWLLALSLAVTGSIGTIDRTKPAPPVEYAAGLLIQIGVANLDRAIAFYTGPLGFRMTERRDDLQFAHLATNVPGLQIGLNQVPSPKGSGSIILNIDVFDVKASRARLEARGVRFNGPTQIIPGKVALAQFSDPDGNVLTLAGPDRLKKAGAGSAAPCDRPEMHGLDFWIGRWEVRNHAGRAVAKSTIERVADGCGVLERYDGEPGPAGQRYAGSGLHVFDLTTQSWRQFWGDNRPAITEMNGHAAGGAVTYEWSITDPQGARVAKRYTLSPAGDGVRQLGERLDPGGKWVPEFDLRYRKLE